MGGWWKVGMRGGKEEGEGEERERLGEERERLGEERETGYNETDLRS